MDNLAHTLTGAAPGQLGLKRLSGFGMSALVVGANLPDIDVLGLPFGESLAWRRGWTHGPIAAVLLPTAMAGAFVAFDRWQARRGSRRAARPPVHFGKLLLLGFIGVLSHLLLDLMNVYGVRLLMPFSEQWFYGDVLFIIDPWIWIALGIGVWLSRRREKIGLASARGPVAVGILTAMLYCGAMAVAGRAAERYAAREFAALGLGRPEQILAAPVPINPFQREIVVQTADGYGFGRFDWLPTPAMTLDEPVRPTNMDDPAIGRARAQDKAIADFLYWSRYPFAIVEAQPGGTSVTVSDARYNRPSAIGRFSVNTLIRRAP